MQAYKKCLAFMKTLKCGSVKQLFNIHLFKLGQRFYFKTYNKYIDFNGRDCIFILHLLIFFPQKTWHLWRVVQLMQSVNIFIQIKRHTNVEMCSCVNEGKKKSVMQNSLWSLNLLKHRLPQTTVRNRRYSITKDYLF